MFSINYKDKRPIYEQLADKIKQLILSGVFSEDEQLPSVRQLAVELAVNPNTIQKAYVELERQGIIYSVKGKGSFVATNQSNLVSFEKDELDNKLHHLVQDYKKINIDKNYIINRVNYFFDKEVKND